MSIDRSEYLVVVDSYGDGSEDYGIRVHSFRCNRKDTADAAADWLNRIRGTDAKVFHDPPPDGPVREWPDEPKDDGHTDPLYGKRMDSADCGEN